MGLRVKDVLGRENNKSEGRERLGLSRAQGHTYRHIGKYMCSRLFLSQSNNAGLSWNLMGFFNIKISSKHGLFKFQTLSLYPSQGQYFVV